MKKSPLNVNLKNEPSIITKKNIEKLGFKYICGDLKNKIDLTFNLKIHGDLYICLVFQPLNNEITLSSHTDDIGRTLQRLHQSKMSKMTQLQKVLKKLLIIESKTN